VALKIESFLNFASIFKISAKIAISKFETEIKISESKVGLYVISLLIFLRVREIAQEGGKIMKVSPKLRQHFWENIVSSALIIFYLFMLFVFSLY